MSTTNFYDVEFRDPLMFAVYPGSPSQDLRNPYPDYARLLSESPIHQAPNAFDPAGLPSFYVYDLATVSKVLLDGDTFSARPLFQLFEPTMGKYLMAAMDEPDHARYRALVSPAFRPRLLARWEDKLIKRVINEMLDKFAHEGRADLVRQFTFVFPARIIAEIMGLPGSAFRDFFQWAVDILCLPFDREKAIASGAALKDFFATLVVERRKNPGDDLISELVKVEIDGRKLEDEEIFSFLRFLLPAGMETTYRATGSTLFHLLEQPAQFDLVRRDYALIPRALEEALRMEPPLPFLSREALADTELGGVPVPQGSTVYAVVASSNRDPAVMDNPQRFDIQRAQVKHLSFGYGMHICLGMHLARLEGRLAMEAFMERLPNMRWDTAEKERVDAHMHGVAFRGPTALPVMWDV